MNGVVSQNISIPSGKRLVVDFVDVVGSAASTSGGVQPLVLLASSVSGSPSVNYYIEPVQSAPAPGHFYYSAPVKIYSDSLNVSSGYTGYYPYQLNETVVISGHLITP